MNILIADDEVDLRESISDLIQLEYTCEVDLCGDGAEAYLACQKKKYDFIILDYRMPNVTGVEFYNNLSSSDNANKNTKILFLSGFIEEVSSLVEKTENTYFNSKPIKPQVLLDFIGSVQS